MFRVGDKVWSSRMGWGIVVEVNDGSIIDARVKVKFNRTIFVTYSQEGRQYASDLLPSLFFEEIPIPETAFVRPKWRAEKCDLYFYIDSDGLVEPTTEGYSMADDRRLEFGNYFQTKEDAMESKFYKVFHG